MSGVLNIQLAAGGSVFTDTFNITTGTMGGGVGYSDGSGGTSTGVVTGSITGGTLTGGKLICEVSIFSGVSQDRLRVRGFSSDPGQLWLTSATVNGVTKTQANLGYSWDATHNTASWLWARGFGNDWPSATPPQTYNGNTAKHKL